MFRQDAVHHIQSGSHNVTLIWDIFWPSSRIRPVIDGGTHPWLRRFIFDEVHGHHDQRGQREEDDRSRSRTPSRCGGTDAGRSQAFLASRGWRKSHSAEENRPVSRNVGPDLAQTSAPRLFSSTHFARYGPTVTLPSLSYHAGIRQSPPQPTIQFSPISRIREKYMFSYCLRHDRMPPFSTASTAGFASIARTDVHWSVSIGSITTPPRSP